MRVTHKMVTNNYLSNLNRNLSAMQKSQEQLSSFTEISKPSDNPYEITRIMRMSSSLTKNEQYLSNIDNSLGWLDATDTAITSTISAIQRVYELSFQGANGTYSNSQMSTMADEMSEIIDEVAQYGNSSYQGRYIFAGHNTTQLPFAVDSGTELLDVSGGTTGDILTEFSPGVTMSINISANKFLDPSGSESIGITLQKVHDALRSGDSGALGAYMDDIEKQLDAYLALASEVGAKTNRMESAKEKNKADNLNMTEVLSKIQDIDLAEKTIEFNSISAVYNATLSVGAHILQPTLLDFLG